MNDGEGCAGGCGFFVFCCVVVILVYSTCYVAFSMPNLTWGGWIEGLGRIVAGTLIDGAIGLFLRLIGIRPPRE